MNAVTTLPRITASTSDDLLLAAIAEGNRDALTLLYKRHATTLRRAAVAVIGKHDETIAEDAVTDVFVALLEGRASTFRPERGRALAWLKGIACAAAGEHLRGRTSARAKKRVKKQSTKNGGDA